MEYVDFGNTGLRVSRLAFGTGTHGWGGRSEQTDLGVDGLADLLRLSYSNGINFWDAADQYGSHPAIAEALSTVPRQEIVIATKTTSREASQAMQDVERFLKELDTDVLDIVLLHWMTQPDWPHMYSGAMAALSRAKEQGKVRAVGVSCHGLGPLQAALDSDWVDVVLARINLTGSHMSAPRCDIAHAVTQLFMDGKAVYGMKVLGCGELARSARSSMEYVFGLGVVHSITVGISSHEQLLENAKLVEELTPQYPIQSLAETLIDDQMMDDRSSVEQLSGGVV